MSSSKRQQGPCVPFRLRVTEYPSGQISYDSRITLYDGWDDVIAEAEGELSNNLPRGLYTARIERAGVLAEHVIRHEQGTDETIPAPLRVSAAPVFDTATTHEYYAYTSQAWSDRDTRKPIGAPGRAHGRLFVFIRTLSAQHYQGEDLAAGLHLLDAQGAPISRFSQAETERSDDGWMALSARAEPGLYRLRYEGERPREMVLYVGQGFDPMEGEPAYWNTQLFIGYQQRLRFETAVVLMPNVLRSFDPDDRVAQAVDAALAGIQQGRDYMPRGVMNQLLRGKFNNPMLGLLGAHLLLRRAEPKKSTINIVLRNLANLLEDSPDVQALRLMAAERFAQRLPIAPFARPPMLRAGLEAVLRLSAKHPELVPENSLIEQSATRLLVDSPWASWEPVPETKTAAQTADWVSAYLEDTLLARQHSKRSLDLTAMASQVGIPVRLLERAYNSLDTQKLAQRAASAGDDLKQIRGIGSAIEGTLKDLGYSTYQALASIDKNDVARIKSHLGRFASQLDKHEWVQQARKLVDRKSE